jgi:hypothetical protein
VRASRPLSLSGVELDGDSLVRLIYLDESGISINEPVVMVAGVMVDADKQWKLVEEYVEELIAEYVSEDDRDGFVFHGTELFRGSGKIFGNRQKYPPERSREALRKILTIPALFRLPIVSGCVRKRPVPKLTKEGRRHEAAKNHMFAFALCVAGAEKYMNESVDPSEIAKLSAENNTDTRQAVKMMHDLLKGRNLHLASAKGMFSELSRTVPNSLPIRRIVDSVSFEEKNDAIFLQIADACALVLRYFYESKPNIEDLLDALTNNNPSALGDKDKLGGFLTLGWVSKSTEEGVPI